MRGRPRGRYPSNVDHRLLEYLALVSTKHDVKAEALFTSLIDAWDHQEARCGTLLIQCRTKKVDSGIFLLLYFKSTL